MNETGAETHSHRKEHKLAHPPKTRGLDALDRERAASLADEGGSAAARLEGTVPLRPGKPRRANLEDEPLSKRRWIFVPFALVLWALAAPCSAQTYLAPSAGLAFGGSTDQSRVHLGGDIAFVSRGPFGFSVDFGYVRNFFGDSAPGGRNNVTSLMGDLMLISSGKPRLYASGGVGLMKTRVEDVPGFLNAHANDWGMNVGVGAYVMGDGAIGFKGDVRYFRRLTDPERDGQFDLALGKLHYWRATAGIALKF